MTAGPLLLCSPAAAASAHLGPATFPVVEFFLARDDTDQVTGRLISSLRAVASFLLSSSSTKSSVRLTSALVVVVSDIAYV